MSFGCFSFERIVHAREQVEEELGNYRVYLSGVSDGRAYPADGRFLF